MAKSKHIPVNEQAPSVRIQNFDEVVLGYSENEALQEANRCLQCKLKPCIDGCPIRVNIDLIILLQGSPSLAWERIQQRGREMEIEGGWKLTEIQNLNEWYKTYAADVVKFGFHQGTVLEIDVEKLDLTNRIHVGYIFERVHEILKAGD